MNKHKIIVILLVIMRMNCYGQVTESRFHYQILRDSTYATTNNQFHVQPFVDAENFTTRAEQNYFIRLFFGSDLYENMEITKIDTSEFRVKFTELNDTRGFYFKELNALNVERQEYTSLATFTNHTKDTIYFPARFFILYGIFEAIDNHGKWKPVQYCYNYGLGDHMEDLRLLPNQELLIPFNSNLGAKEAVMRLKIHGNDTIYFSSEFTGYIDESDFIVPNPLIDKYDESMLFLNEIIFQNIEEEIEYDFTPMEE